MKGWHVRKFIDIVFRYRQGFSQKIPQLVDRLHPGANQILPLITRLNIFKQNLPAISVYGAYHPAVCYHFHPAFQLRDQNENTRPPARLSHALIQKMLLPFLSPAAPSESRDNKSAADTVCAR